MLAQQEQQVAGNGFAVAALVLGIVGAVFGLVPLTGFIALVCGALATIFGAVGWKRVKRLGAPHRGMAIAGLILGVVAVTLGIVGLVILGQAANELEKELEKLGALAL